MRMNRRKAEEIRKLEVIAAQASRVREMQKTYFQTRNHAVLKECQVQERLLDKMLAEYFSKQERLL